MNDEVTRLNINVNAEVAEFLREAAERENRTITEVVRRAVSVYKFVAYDEAGELYVERDNGERLRVMIL